MDNKPNELIVITIQQYVLIQMCLDEIDNLFYNESVKSKFRYEIKKTINCFNTIRKRMKRQLEADEMEAFEASIADITDSMAEHINYVKAMLKDNMVNKIPYQQLDVAVVLCMIFGFLDILQTVKVKMTGKKESIYSQASEYMGDIDKGMHFSLMNDEQPDPHKQVAPFVTLFTALRECVVNHIKVNKLYEVC